MRKPVRLSEPLSNDDLLPHVGEYIQLGASPENVFLAVTINGKDVTLIGRNGFTRIGESARAAKEDRDAANARASGKRSFFNGIFGKRGSR